MPRNENRPCALRDKDGKLVGFGKVTRDLTERRLNEEKIKKQAQEILEMATVPVVQVWEGIMLVPLIGTLDSQRTQQLMERLQPLRRSAAELQVSTVPSLSRKRMA